MKTKGTVQLEINQEEMSDNVCVTLRIFSCEESRINTATPRQANADAVDEPLYVPEEQPYPWMVLSLLVTAIIIISIVVMWGAVTITNKNILLQQQANK